MKKYKRIVLHIPHSSDRLPKDCVWSGDVRKVLDRWTDWHTDTLFSSSREDVESFIYSWSRLYCDIERLIDDPMENIGQGIAYRLIDGCIRELSEDELTRHIPVLQSSKTDFLRYGENARDAHYRLSLISVVFGT